jgi:hypothetical protein
LTGHFAGHEGFLRRFLEYGIANARRRIGFADGTQAIAGRYTVGAGDFQCQNSFATQESRMASSALIGILITFLVVILVLYLVNMLPVDGRMKQIIRIIVIIIGVISMLKYLAIF